MTPIRMQKASRSKRSALGGFTLIELMIVVAVIAILAAIAYPNYADSVRKGRRGQAKSDMLELAQLLERSRTVNNGYEAFVLPFNQSPKTGAAHYILDLPQQTAGQYQLRARPQGAQTKDTRCGTLTLNQAGVKGIAADATGTVEECW